MGADPTDVTELNVPWPLMCASCGRPLGDDVEDEPDGDAGLPICGECNRERNWAAIEELDMREEGGRWDDH